MSYPNDDIYADADAGGAIYSADFFDAAQLAQAAKAKKKKKKKKKSGVATTNQQPSELYAMASPRAKEDPEPELYAMASPGAIAQGPEPELYAMASPGANTQDSETEVYALATRGGRLPPNTAPRRRESFSGFGEDVYEEPVPYAGGKGASAKSPAPPPRRRESFSGFGEDVYEEPMSINKKWQPLKTKSGKESGLECQWVPCNDNPRVTRPVFRFVNLGAQSRGTKSASDLLNIAFLVYPTKAMGVIQKQWMLHRSRAIIISNVVVGAAVFGAIGGAVASMQSTGASADPIAPSSIAEVQNTTLLPSTVPSNNFTTTTTATGHILPTVTVPSSTTVINAINSTVSGISTISSTQARTIISDTTNAATSAINTSMTTATATSRTTGTSTTGTNTTATVTTLTRTTPTTVTTRTVTSSTLTTVTQTTATVTSVTTRTFTSITQPRTEQTGATQGPRRLYRRAITNTTYGLSLGFNDLGLYVRTPSTSWWPSASPHRFMLPEESVANITAAISTYFVSRRDRNLPISAQSIDYGVWHAVEQRLPSGIPIQIATFGGPFANARGDHQPPTLALRQAYELPGADLRETVYITLRYYLYRAFGMDPYKNLKQDAQVPQRFSRP